MTKLEKLKQDIAASSDREFVEFLSMPMCGLCKDQKKPKCKDMSHAFCVNKVLESLTSPYKE